MVDNYTILAIHKHKIHIRIPEGQVNTIYVKLHLYVQQPNERMKILKIRGKKLVPILVLY